MGLTIASWNGEKKLSPHDWHTWMNVLRRLPSARLCQHIARPEADAGRRLVGETVGAGVHAASRLELPGRVPLRQYYRRIAAADLVLDVPRWNGVSSSLDILWAGSPLLALPLQLMLSRMSAALLAALGVPHGIVASSRGLVDAAAFLLCATRPRCADIVTK